MKSTPQVNSKSVLSAIAVLATVFALCSFAFLAVHMSLANPMLPKALRDLPRLLGVCIVAWNLWRGARWARWVALAVSLSAATLLLFGFLGPFQAPSAGMSFVPFLYCIARPAIALCYIIVAAALLFYRPVVIHFRQTPVMTNDSND